MTLAARPGAHLVAATDDNDQGEIYAARLLAIADETGCSAERLRPLAEETRCCRPGGRPIGLIAV